MQKETSTELGRLRELVGELKEAGTALAADNKRLLSLNADLTEGNRKMNRTIDGLIADLDAAKKENVALRGEIRALREGFQQKSEDYQRMADKYAKVVRGSVAVGLPTGVLIGVVATVIAIGVVLNLAGLV